MEENKLSAAEEPNKDASRGGAVDAKILSRRRRAGVTIYGLSAILALTYMLNRNQPVRTLLDLIAWIVLFFVISFLIWLVPMALFARYMEVSREYEGPTPTVEK